MKRSTIVVLIVIAAAIGWTVSAGAAGNDWPQWRGPLQDGISRETGLLDTWPAEGLPELWRVPLGAGYSGISVADGKVYTLCGIDGVEQVACLSAETGGNVWNVRLAKDYENNFGGGPRGAPTIDNGKVYALGATGAMVCLNAGNGETIWALDLVKEHGAVIPEWGISGSPVIDGEKLFVIAGGPNGHSILALNKETGKSIWTSLDDMASYSTPLLIEVDGMKQVVCLLAKHCVAVSPEDGRELWRIPWETNYDINAATPIFHDNKLFLASGYDTGSGLFALSAQDGKAVIEEVWLSKRMKNQFSTSVLIDGYLYGFHNKVMQCMEFDTGEIMWSERGFNHGSILPADGKLIILGEKSQLALAEISPEAYKEISRAELITGKTWTIPTIANGKMYVRNEKEIVCVDLKKH